MPSDSLQHILRLRSDQVLPDNAEWQHRFEIVGSTGRVYVIAQHKAERYWGCSCDGWKHRRECRHLHEHRLAVQMRPYEVEIVVAGRTVPSPVPRSAPSFEAARLNPGSAVRSASGPHPVRPAPPAVSPGDPPPAVVPATPAPIRRFRY